MVKENSRGYQQVELLDRINVSAADHQITTAAVAVLSTVARSVLLCGL
jgi:hypothetical protein